MDSKIEEKSGKVRRRKGGKERRDKRRQKEGREVDMKTTRRELE